MKFTEVLVVFSLILKYSQSVPLIESGDQELGNYGNTEPNPGTQSNHLISSVYQGFEPNSVDDDDDSDVVQVLSNEDTNKDPNIFDLSIYGSSLYRIPDYGKTARLLEEYLPEKSSVNPEELGPYVEGDILIPQSSVILKNGLVSRSSRWPEGIVPYEVGGSFRRRELRVIGNAFNEYHQKTCIRFVPRTTETDYISIVNGKSGCWSSIGRVGGKQDVNLQTPGCLSKPGTAMHELMHVLGFLHEQNREERDGFVDIQYQNIKQAAYENFKKISPTAAFGVPYDYGSVMHYSSKAFSQNGQVTIVAKQPEGNGIMGQRNGFSSLDLEKINRMYNCFENERTDEPPPAVDLATSTTSFPFRAGPVIRDFFGNVLSGLSRVG